MVQVEEFESPTFPLMGNLVLQTSAATRICLTCILGCLGTVDRGHGQVLSEEVKPKLDVDASNSFITS